MYDMRILLSNLDYFMLIYFIIFFSAQQNVVSGPTKRTGNHLAGASASSDDQRDETDYYSGLSRGHSFDLVTLLDRLHQGNN